MDAGIAAARAGADPSPDRTEAHSDPRRRSARAPAHRRGRGSPDHRYAGHSSHRQRGILGSGGAMPIPLVLTLVAVFATVALLSGALASLALTRNAPER